MITRNIIVNDDALKYTRDMPSNVVDLIILDPPYGDVVKDVWDTQNAISIDLVAHLFRVLKPTGSLYLWCGIGEKSQSLMRWWPIFAKQFVFKDIITLAKTRGIGMRRGWLYTREEVLWFVKDNKAFRWNLDAQYSTERRIRDNGQDTIKLSQNGYQAKSLYKRWTNIWTDIPEESYNITIKIPHSTPKPIKALRRIIEAHTQPGDVVYDCFLGSGSTAIACIKTGRDYIGVEINQEIYDAALYRVESNIVKGSED